MCLPREVAAYLLQGLLKVIRRILDLATKGTRVHYLTGNHDEMLRKFSESHMGNFSIADKLVLDLDGQKAWIFHGDVFDASVNHAKWIAKLGGLGYDYLILAAGAQHSYFGRDEWEPFAPGLKTIEQATEIRRRVLTAFERKGERAGRAIRDLTYRVTENAGG